MTGVQKAAKNKMREAEKETVHADKRRRGATVEGKSEREKEKFNKNTQRGTTGGCTCEATHINYKP